MRPFNYVSSTGNFRRLAERLGSRRLKVQWSPADALLSAEWDQASAGFLNLKPHLHSLHMKDVQVLDWPGADFGWRALGDGQVDYLTILRNLRHHRSEAVLAVATHFRPPSGSLIEAMHINVAKLKALIAKVETDTAA